MLQRSGHVAYKLDLPEESRIHHVFHVSQLKKKLGHSVQVQHQYPTESVEQIQEPESIIERRMVNRAGQAASEILVKWKYVPAEEATWENYWSMVKRYPSFDLETRSNLRGKY